MFLLKKFFFLIVFCFCMDMPFLHANRQDDEAAARVILASLCIGTVGTGVYGVCYRLFLRVANRQILQQAQNLLFKAKNLHGSFQGYAISSEKSQPVVRSIAKFKQDLESTNSELSDIKNIMSTRKAYFWNVLYKEKFENHCKESDLISKHLKVDLNISEGLSKLDALSEIFKKHNQCSDINKIALLITNNSAERFPLIKADQFLQRTVQLLNYYCDKIHCPAEVKTWLESISDEIKVSDQLKQQIRARELHEEEKATKQRAIDLERAKIDLDRAKIAQVQAYEELIRAKADKKQAEAFKNKADGVANGVDAVSRAAVAYTAAKHGPDILKGLTNQPPR